MHKLHCTVGIFAHNEEKNITALIESLEAQKMSSCEVDEIIVVSSGSFDKTNRIVRKWEKQDTRVRLVAEARRRGKSAAINAFLREAESPIVVTISADLVLDEHALEEIMQPFFEDDVGMVGAHPKPLNTHTSSVGREVELLWQLHHAISLVRPKCGEMVAFRNLIREIPHDSAVDEATIEVLLKIIGYEIRYAPLSIVYNHGPMNVAEFIRQRRRVYAGHQWVSQRYNYQVVTMEAGSLFQVGVQHLLSKPQDLTAFFWLVVYELAARMFGWVDYHVFDKNPYVWSMIQR